MEAGLDGEIGSSRNQANLRDSLGSAGEVAASAPAANAALGVQRTDAYQVAVWKQESFVVLVGFLAILRTIIIDCAPPLRVELMPMNPRVLVIFLGLSLVLLAWIGLLSAGVPTLYCPMPTMTVIPAFALSSWNLQGAAVLVPMILFFLWNPGLLVRQQSNLPKRTIGLVGVLSVLTIVDFVLEWKYGVQYRGVHHTIAVYTINVLWLAVLWWAVVRAWRRPSFGANLLSHWVLFAWLGWFAFPYLGELP